MKPITLCSVVTKPLLNYLPVFLYSVRQHTSLVEEIILVQTDAESEGLLWSDDELGVKLYGFPFAEQFGHPDYFRMILGHAMGLHYAIDLVKTPYCWLSDPDIFLFNPVDEIFIYLLEYFQLNIVGIGHFNVREQSYLDFPCVTNCLLRTKDLPPADWLKEDLIVRTSMIEGHDSRDLGVLHRKYYLAPCKVRESVFPNPSGYFDVGCNLYLYGHEQSWRWLSFRLPHNFQFEIGLAGFNEAILENSYNVRHYRSNANIEEDFGGMYLLYHRTRGHYGNGIDMMRFYEELTGNVVPESYLGLPPKIAHQ